MRGLVLSRKRNEQVILHAGTPAEVIVSVVEIKGEKVRLHFAAAAEVSIDRMEIHNSKLREKEQRNAD